jgi:uncharacterized protein YjeT (DUF2065 family)
MKLSKISVALSLVATLALSSALGSLAQAGSINYKGISSVTVEDEYGMQLHRGLTLNFSFGGPKDYRQKKSVQDIQKANLDSAKLEAYGVLIVAIGIGILTWTE